MTTAAIDWTRVQTAEATAGAAAARRKAAVNAECRRRIFAVVDDAAQLNLAGAAAGDLLTEAQLATYQAGMMWIHAMRARATDLHVSAEDFMADAAWPVPSAEVEDLAAEF